jgi:hypothetical protein
MWGSPTFVEERNMYVLLLDFEGLYQPLKEASSTASCDCKLFALAILVSSLVLFNSKYKLEDKSMDQFSMLLDLQRFIKIRQPPMPQ